MKFPNNHCVPTKLLTKESYSDLICRLVSEGYLNMVPHLAYDLMMMWDFLGVGVYEDINVFTHPHSFMEPNDWMDYRGVADSEYPNVLTKEFLEGYLK